VPIQGVRASASRLYGFEDMCDVIVYSHEVGWLKPDPRIYHRRPRGADRG
jgi:putative hydrolase of the HAD superfamily